jgi:ABC-type multidrug transport system fused ATPase/permease subunit
MRFGFQTGPVMFVVLFAVEAASGVLGLYVTYANKQVVDAAVAASVRGVLFAAAAMSAARAAQLICGHQYVNVTRKVREKTQLLVDQKLMAMTGELPGLEHEELPEYADQLALLRADRWAMAEVANGLVLSMRVAIRVLGSAALLVRLHPALVVLPLAGIPSFLAAKRATVAWRPQGNEIAQRDAERTAERSRTIHHLFARATSADAGKELRLFGLAGELIGRHRRLTGEVMAEHERADWQGAALNVAGAVCFAAGYVAAIGLVLWRAVNGQATAGDVVLATLLAAQMDDHVALAVQTGSRFMRMLRATGRYLWLVEYGQDVRAAWAQTAADPLPVPERLVGGITLEGVSFSYPGTEKEVLGDVSAHLPAGSVVALVGENGAGKTTLIKLLERFYVPAAGRILVDGVDLRRLNLEAWRARTSAAFQDFRQFEFLVRETVGVGNLPAVQDGAAVGRALIRAGADDVVAALPAGLETQLGRAWIGGVELSGGQWQKLALGRAFMREAPLLVTFDEPTAAIDAPTEHALFERFAAAARSGASRGTVTLIVSHRFSTVRMADLILVLDGERIVERGSHADLMRLNGAYAELYELQARAYR